MTTCLFATDLHGRLDRYEKLFADLEKAPPDLVFLGGDLLPHHLHAGDYDDFLSDVIGGGLTGVRERLGPRYPRILAILGNDDPKSEEGGALRLHKDGLWQYAHNRRLEAGDYAVIGYSYVPPTPFLNKDWERYDVSRYVPPGSVSPEEGFRSVAVEPRQTRFATIQQDLDALADGDLGSTILLVHTPPHDTHLDRVNNDGRKVDHVPLDLHVGSIALRRFIERWQPLLSLHGHIHESTRLTGHWRDRIGRTHMFNAAHDGPELSVIRFRLEDLESAERRLL